MHTTPYRIVEKNYNKYSFLCLNEKEKNYYRVYDGCKSIIDLTLANLLIVPDIIWSKKYYFISSDHFSIRNEREIPTKHQQTWIIKRSRININRGGP